MRRILKAGRYITVLSVVLFLNSVSAIGADISIEESRVAWNEFLSKHCETGQTEQAIRKLMNGKYRDIGLAPRANAEVHRVLFLVDDFHQIEFAFHRDSGLLLTPTIEPRGQWLRMPSGDVQSIPNPAELRLRSKAEEAAIEYIVNQTDHNRGSLSVYCRRSAKAQTWDVVVTLNTLEVDTPSYLLKVTDNGQVIKARP